MNIIQAKRVADDCRIAVVVSRFNDFITTRLLSGALDALARGGVPSDNITVIWVPGAHEIPLVVKAVAEQKKAHAIVALGCVIRGATAHFDYVAGECCKGLTQVSLEFSLPVTNGVLTVESIEQAIERAGSKAGNKGADAASSALDTLSLLNQL